MTTVANGRCTSAPAPVAIAIGTKPRLAIEHCDASQYDKADRRRHSREGEAGISLFELMRQSAQTFSSIVCGFYRCLGVRVGEAAASKPL